MSWDLLVLLLFPENNNEAHTALHLICLFLVANECREYGWYTKVYTKQ